MSTEQPTCMGCFMNTNYPWPVSPPPYNGAGGVLPYQTASYVEIAQTPVQSICFLPTGDMPGPHLGMTAEELQVIEGLVQAWKAFQALGEKHPDDNNEFRTAIHAAQKMIALRIARRVDPHIWFQPEDNNGNASPE